jgi:hypothetical protein
MSQVVPHRVSVICHAPELERMCRLTLELLNHILSTALADEKVLSIPVGCFGCRSIVS